jgi:hypothetical protein
MSNHRARTWDHRGSKPFDPKLLPLGHHLDGYGTFICNLSNGDPGPSDVCSKVKKPSVPVLKPAPGLSWFLPPYCLDIFANRPLIWYYILKHGGFWLSQNSVFSLWFQSLQSWLNIPQFPVLIAIDSFIPMSGIIHKLPSKNLPGPS